MKKNFRWLTLCLLTACAATPDNPDPHRTFNENALEFNMDLDDYVLRPLASGYKAITPDVMQESVSNFLMNWKEPFYCVNYVVSLDAEHAANSVFRFVINTTFGILGLFDVAEQIGLEKAETSYKATLKKIEMPNGDYLVLPVFGSSSTRDAIAEPISWFADPVGYFIGFPYMLVKAIFGAVNDRASNMQLVNDMKKDKSTMYSAMKSVYFQKFVTGYSDNEEDDDEEEEIAESETKGKIEENGHSKNGKSDHNKQVAKGK
ncbi:MAG: VacJ family lipoprotein [Alphaproteobacteria bacterium]|nr:VacJ family lipoprotein [Alphaproteobacteria bacterium]